MRQGANAFPPSLAMSMRAGRRAAGTAARWVRDALVHSGEVISKLRDNIKIDKIIDQDGMTVKCLKRVH